MGYRLGVDLGTTYTAAAVCRDGRAEMLALGDRSPVIPSVVAIREDGTVLTGDAAERRMSIEPDRVVREFKRRFGDPAPILIGGAPYGAEALQAHLLRAVVAKATEREGEPPERVALTYPANWGPYKQELVNQVLALAGLDADDVDLLTEPEAAAIHYASQERVEPGALVAVYDLGGGTFDAAVLRRTTTGYEIAGPVSGIERMGGIDFDAAVFEFVRAQLGDAADPDPDDPDAMASWAELRRDCVEGKEALAADTDTEIVATLPNLRERIRLTRVEFEEMARPSIRQTVDALRRAVAAAGAEPDDLTSVLLVGGSSRIPLVAQEVSTALGRPVAIDAHPKYAIALGAALAGVADAESAVAPETGAVPATAPPPPTAPSPEPGAAPPPVAPTPPPRPQPEPAPTGPAKKSGRGRLLVGVVVVLALIAAAGAFLVLGGDPAEAAELVLEPNDSTGVDPFTTQTSGTPLDVTKVTFDTGGATGETIVVNRRGTAPGLYGGTQEQAVCDPDQLVEFLSENPAKAAAWAGVHDIEVAAIASFVDGLTPVTLMTDTRVTNHGFTDGAANPLQSVLEAGTAVMVDEFGVPRVKCNCGNPLLEPAAIGGDVETTGTPWPGFDASTLVAITPGDAAASRLVLTDVDGGDPFSRGVGTAGEDDQPCDEACGVELSDAAGPPTTGSPSEGDDELVDDITPDGSVEVSSVFNGNEFPGELAVDNDLTTSWFSAGPESDGTARFEWFLSDGTDGVISIVELSGNEEHSNPDFRTGFGFEEVTLRVTLDGEVMFEESRSLAGTPDPFVSFEPEVVGDIVELTFTGSEDPECGGFSELVVFGSL